MLMRRCPACDADLPRVRGALTARQITEGNTTYRNDALLRLDLAGSEEFEFAECGGCGFLYALREPTPEFLTRVYDEVIDADVARVESQSPSWTAHQLRIAATLLGRFTESSVTILDYGCGYGTILRALRSPTVRSVGYEPYQSVVSALASEGLEVVTTHEELRERAPFDGAVLSDVLEHVSDPRGTLATCHELIRPGGAICVSVPDFSDDRRDAILRDLKAHLPVTRELNPWEHLNYFSPQSLSRMLSSEGFHLSPHADADFGLRAGNTGIRRLGNGLKSAARLLRFVLSPHATTTTVVAQRL
jgi:SAM-dependent methyltransferase